MQEEGRIAADLHSLEHYLRSLPPEKRVLARVWGETPGPEFQARIGPEIEEIKWSLDRLTEQNRRWYNLRLSEAARLFGAALIGIFTRGAGS